MDPLHLRLVDPDGCLLASEVPQPDDVHETEVPALASRQSVCLL